jgi:protein SCO1/2
MTTRHLSKMVDKAREALGADSFNVATLGFDVQHDSPQSLRQFARNQGIDGDDWLLLSADESTVGELMERLGFSYVPSPRGFDHVIQATVIDGDGRIYRQVYGEVFETPLLVEPLKELVLGRPKPGQPLLSDLLDRIRFFCTTYDPSRDAYHFDLSIFIGMTIGALILILSFLFVVRELIRHKRSAQI